MSFGEGEDAFSVLDRFLDRKSAVTRRELRELGYGRRLVGCAVKWKVIRPVGPGLFVDARTALDERWILLRMRLPQGVVTLESAGALLGLTPDWPGPLQVAISHGRHVPRKVCSGIECLRRREGWTEDEVVALQPPDPNGVTVRCFTPLRTFVELSAARHLDTAGEAGRELLRRGERAETLVESMLRLGLSRKQVGEVLFELFAGGARPRGELHGRASVVAVQLVSSHSSRWKRRVDLPQREAASDLPGEFRTS